ncbi:LacI family DNA-binding transcriptional regulator [Tropicimonas sp. IMCC34043]|uniref:LacI family DNA-binding transcriptional regulator n=1 Tax=Tropicimonas sp. IMCC34043 TaxID=2248760 RepID=UPI0018E4E65F|nr:LacI family DNA-binding transcriptional regulator [Tropicimonas sp. IMCC34043]
MTKPPTKRSSDKVASKPATIRDVAAQAGVSIGTVSRVVSGSIPVSAELSQRVVEAVDRLNYRPRSRTRPAPLADTGVKLISCFVSDISNLLYGQVVSAAEERLAQSGYVLVVANTGNDLQRQDKLLSLLRERRVTGAIISFGEETHPGLGAELKSAGVPVVILDRTAPPGIDSIHVDHRGGALDACSYLVGLGHRRIGMIIASSRIRPGIDRIAGFREAHRRAGLAAPDALIRTDCITADAAFAEVTRLLRMPERPTALISLGSQALGGTLRAIREMGLEIPKDVSVICLGDTELAKVMTPSITCIQWDRWQLGRQTVDMLLHRMANPGAEARTMTLPTEFILRNSCQEVSPPTRA